MSIKTRAIRLTGVLMACAMLSLSAGFAWTVVDDYGAREIVPEGVSVAGNDLGGLTREQAREVIEADIAAPLFEPVVVSDPESGASWEFDPADMLRIDVDAMVERAFDPKTGSTLADRAYRRLAEVSVPVEIETMLSLEGDASEWLDSVASEVDTPPVSAAFFIDEGAIVKRTHAPGRRTDVRQAEELLTEALLSGEKSIRLPVESVEPTLAAGDLGQTLHVSLSERKVYLYEGLDLIESYGIAIGTPSHPTPRGTYEVTLKRYMPTWSNPGSAWAANMPASIPPGPSNPLGTRAINISAPGIRFHGTTQNWSIGRAASHGCMRMHRWDVEDLYERVEVGARVLIVR